jgi:hypothetical protein
MSVCTIRLISARKLTAGKQRQTEDCGSEFEATLQGIKRKSSVPGLLILAISMVFF